MNNTLLSTALLSILCANAYADNAAQPTTPSAASQAVSAPPAPITGATGTAAAPSNPATPQTPSVIDCHYRIPAETTNIDETTISTWVKKASVQSFDFNPASIDEELEALKSCYTDQGWQGFNDALQKSGNINAIKSQHLTVSSQVSGEVKINILKDNQWKVTVPMQVVYQNDKEKLTQKLTVDLLIGRKITGDLGIMQMIATPQQPAGAEQPAVEQPAGAQQPTAAPAPEKQPGSEINKPVTQH